MLCTWQMSMHRGGVAGFPRAPRLVNTISSILNSSVLNYFVPPRSEHSSARLYWWTIYCIATFILFSFIVFYFTAHETEQLRTLNSNRSRQQNGLALRFREWADLNNCVCYYATCAIALALLLIMLSRRRSRGSISIHWFIEFVRFRQLSCLKCYLLSAATVTLQYLTLTF